MQVLLIVGRRDASRPRRQGSGVVNEEHAACAVARARPRPQLRRAGTQVRALPACELPGRQAQQVGRACAAHAPLRLKSRAAISHAGRARTFTPTDTVQQDQLRLLLARGVRVQVSSRHRCLLRPQCSQCLLSVEESEFLLCSLFICAAPTTEALVLNLNFYEPSRKQVLPVRHLLLLLVFSRAERAEVNRPAEGLCVWVCVCVCLCVCVSRNAW